MVEPFSGGERHAQASHGVIAAAAIAIATISAPKPAEARCWGCWAGVGFAAGLIGGAIIASHAYGYGYAPYYGYPVYYGYAPYAYAPAYYGYVSPYYYGYGGYYARRYYPRYYAHRRYYVHRHYARIYHRHRYYR